MAAAVREHEKELHIVLVRAVLLAGAAIAKRECASSSTKANNLARLN
jgi:hypothetical protein